MIPYIMDTCRSCLDSDPGAGLRIGVGDGTTVSMFSGVNGCPAQNRKPSITNCASLQPILLSPMPSFSLEVGDLFSDSLRHVEAQFTR